VPGGHLVGDRPERLQRHKLCAREERVAGRGAVSARAARKGDAAPC
jgi:hypothetical protein